MTWFNKPCVTIFKLIININNNILPSGGVGTTKALSSTALLGSVTSTLSPADTTSSLVFPVEENNTGSMNWSERSIKLETNKSHNHGLIYTYSNIIVTIKKERKFLVIDYKFIKTGPTGENRMHRSETILFSLHSLLPNLHKCILIPYITFIDMKNTR